MSDADGRWPAIPVAEWEATRDTLQLYTQIVGKVRLANEPLANHWWNVPLYVDGRGLTTSLMPHPTGPSFEVHLDFVDHVLRTDTTDGRSATMPLDGRTVAAFHESVLGMLSDLGVATEIWPVPVEIPDAIPFPDDDVHATYDPDAANRFWRALVAMSRVFAEQRASFVGKASPIHFFWGAFDLAHTRFSGRTAPLHPGGAPNCGPEVMWEAYSHEVSSWGYWPGGPGAEGTFYAYSYPQPDGYTDAPVEPSSARWDDALGEFVLPYEDVRTSADPDRTLAEFLASTYEAAATTGGWDRDALERRPW